MNEAFFERLYRGYAAEHLVASQLFRRGFEVFRLPADFGLDLVVTNQFLVAKKQGAASKDFPFALQVKSRWLEPKDTVSGPSGRPETAVEFRISKEEFERIVEQDNAGAVFVTYVPHTKSRAYDPFYFWLHGQQLSMSLKAGFVMTDKEGFTLHVRYRRLPTQTREEFVKEIEQECKLPFEARRRLLKDLPPIFVRNWNATDYLAFGRKSRDRSDTFVFKTIWNVPMNFDSFPDWNALEGFD